jgi:hypothetical protein
VSGQPSPDWQKIAGMPWVSIIELKTLIYLSTLVQDMQTALVEDMQMCNGMHETSPSAGLNK